MNKIRKKTITRKKEKKKEEERRTTSLNSCVSPRAPQSPGYNTLEREQFLEIEAANHHEKTG